MLGRGQPPPNGLESADALIFGVVSVRNSCGLSVCYDDVLRVAREASLKEAEYEVVSAAHVSQALDMLSAVYPSFMILGHTVRLEDQVILAVAAEKLTPRPRVVEMYTYRPNPEISPDARLPSHQGSEALIQVLQNLSSSSSAAGSKQEREAP